MVTYIFVPAQRFKWGFQRHQLLLVIDIYLICLCGLSFVRKKRQEFHFHKSKL